MLRAHIILGLVTVAVSVLWEFATTFKSPRDWKSFAWGALRNAVAAFVLVTFFVMFVSVEDTHDIVARQSENALAHAEHVVSDIGAQTLFARQAQPRIEGMRGRLQRIAAGEIDLDSADDVTGTWVRLFNDVSNSVKATNVISAAFWSSAHNMGTEALATHRTALSRGVRITRLYIVDDADPRAISSTRAIAAQYAAIGVANRFITLRRLERLPSYNDCRTKLAAIDFVVYDESVVLLVTNSSAYDVLSGRLSRNRQAHVDVASQCFDDWWHAASPSL